MRFVLQLTSAVLAVATTSAVGFLLMMRARVPVVQTAVRRMNRRFINPRQLQTAGQRGAAAAVVHHVGRRSGTSYRTPVVAVPIDGGFAIALPYGPTTDWARNVLAAGTAVVEHEGQTFDVGRPTVLSGRGADAAFDDRERRIHRLFGIDDVLRLDAEVSAADHEPTIASTRP